MNGSVHGLPRVALVTYSTKPRGGVVHTLSLGEELCRLGYPASEPAELLAKR